MRDMFQTYSTAAEREAEAELQRFMRQADAAARRPAAVLTARAAPSPPAPLTARDLIDPRIDVAAQRVILQMASAPQTRALAGDLLGAVRGRRVEGIYRQDQRAPALLARRMNLGWWQLIPKGEHAVLVLDPSDLLGARPLVAFSLAAANAPAILAASLGRVWEAFQLWFSGRAKFCPAAPLPTTALVRQSFSAPIANIVPGGFCGPPAAPATPPDRIGQAVDKLRAVVANGKLVSDGQFYMSNLLDDAVKGGEKSFNRAPLTGSEIFNRIWNEYVSTEKPTTPDELKDIFAKQRLELTARQSKNLFEHEKSRCFEVTGKVTRLIVRKGGFPGAKGDATGQVSFSRGNLSTRHERKAGQGFVVVYVNTLAQRVEQVKAALDDGHLIEAGVVSGIDPDSNDPLGNPEHFILVIGYDGDRFIFWDPDANASKSTSFGTGFGFLFFDRAANRFTTAANEADMPVNNNGDQASGQHRYQVITLQARPGPRPRRRPPAP